MNKILIMAWLLFLLTACASSGSGGGGDDDNNAGDDDAADDDATDEECRAFADARVACYENEIDFEKLWNDTYTHCKTFPNDELYDCIQYINGNPEECYYFNDCLNPG